uniref:Transcriptional factor Rlm1 n=1 Tax=Metschnikowia australis TaxID=27321 RepID=A0A6C0MAT5_9ASCO|nr:transcriptional factor Rlm1 [Metschnikowia australis]
MGRRKIEIEPLGDERTRTVTFVKRKAGLFKKAYELSVLCDVDMAVIIVGSDRVYEYLSVDTKELLNYYKHQSPHELKLPEDYGQFKKRHTLKAGTRPVFEDDDTTERNAESDYESVSPEPKRQRTSSSPLNIFRKTPPVNSQFVQLAAPPKLTQRAPADAPLQRPVLRVQIPSDTKSQGDATESVTPIEGLLGKKDKQPSSADGLAPQPPPLNSVRSSFNSKFRSPESRKQMPQLHVPMGKLQTLSPSAGAIPQLPNNGSANFFSSLPPPSPSGQYPPSILPTPVFNQVFNQQYMNQMTDMPGIGPDTSKLRPHLQHQFMNGEQTPGLPSRYLNEIFPSPSNMYPSQEWPTGLTPYTSTMSHFFAGMPPSANGAPSHSLSAPLVSTQRTSLPTAGLRLMPMRAALLLQVNPQATLPEDQQTHISVGTLPNLSGSEFMGQYYKRED